MFYLFISISKVYPILLLYLFY